MFYQYVVMVLFCSVVVGALFPGQPPGDPGESVQGDEGAAGNRGRRPHQHGLSRVSWL